MKCLHAVHVAARRSFAALLVLALSAPGALAIAPEEEPVDTSTPAAPEAITNPILFVTQTPIPGDFTAIASVFGNHRTEMEDTGRGGDLWIRYPNGHLKNLTATAGYGVASGFQGAS